MLILSFCALVLGCILLHAELFGSKERYGSPPWSIGGGS